MEAGSRGCQGGVLLLEIRPDPGGLAARLLQLGFIAVVAEGIEPALEGVRRRDPPIGSVMLPSQPPLPDLEQRLDLLREVAAPGRVGFVVVGERPEPEQLARFRSAGVTLALWEPFTEGELRFVINHLLYAPSRGESRQDVRVPTRLLARVTGGTGEKDALVYSLSLDGAFLETPRPNQTGTQVQVELPLREGVLRLAARVRSTNVPGTGFRRELPKGMGVRFDEINGARAERLARYIDDRARAFQL